MPNLFRIFVIPAFTLLFSNTILALPPPSGDEADPKDNGKREKSDKTISQKPAKKRRADTSSMPNPAIPLPHAPGFQAASLSGSSSFILAAALSHVQSSFISEKQEKRQPMQTINLEGDDDVTEIKKETGLFHPLVEEIGNELRIKFLNPHVCIQCQELMQEKIDEIVKSKREKSKELFSTIFKQNISKLKIKPEKSEDVLESMLLSLQAGLSEQFDEEDANQLYVIIDTVLGDFLGPKLLNEVKSVISRIYPQAQRAQAVPSVQQVAPQIAPNIPAIPRPALQALNPGFSSHVTHPALNLRSELEIISPESLSRIVNEIKNKGGDFKARVKKIRLLKKFQQGKEEKVIEDLLFLLEHTEINQLFDFWINDNILDSHKAIKILSLLSNATQLQALGLMNCRIGEIGVTFLSDHVLPNLKMLTQLGIFGNNAGPTAMLKVIQALAISPCLSNTVGLNLNDNHAGEEAISELANILPSMTKLSQLLIEQNNAGPTAMLKVIQALAKSPCLSNIFNLNLTKNNAGEAAISELASILPQMTKLTGLALAQNNAGPTAMLKVIQALAQSPSLSNLNFLNLSENNAGEAAISELANILPSMTKLSQMFIGQNNAGPTAMLKVIQALAKSPCLSNIVYLNLSENNAGEAAISELANILPSMKSLRGIGIQGNKCGSQAVLKFAEALSHLKNLDAVNLQNNNLDFETMKIVLSHLEKIPTINQVCLTTETEDEIFKQLIEFIKTNHYHLMKALVKPILHR